ncbi:MAG: hypothetical protein WCS94_22070 [Verrucomicrobiota bacterium]
MMMKNTDSVSAAPAFSPVEGESDRAFEAFRAYFELGPRRRYAAAARKVGVAQRTVKRWAGEFDWRGRIITLAARAVEQSASAENALHRADLLDAAARAKSFRDRQFALAESILNVAERYLERMDEDNLDQLSFGDACKAFAFASQLGKYAREADASVAPDQSLRDQLVALLDQACGENLAPKTPSTLNNPEPTRS